MDTNIGQNNQPNISRFPTFDEARAKELTDEILGRMGYSEEASELLIELLIGVTHECKTDDHTFDHHGGFWAIRTAYLYTKDSDKHFNNFLKGVDDEQIH